MLQIVMLIDTVFLSLISADAVAGVGAAIPILYALVGLLITLGTANLGIMGQYLGAKKGRSVAQIFFVSLSLSLVIGVILCVFQVFLSYFLPQFIDFSSEAKSAFSDYLFYLAPLLITDAVFIVATSTINVHGFTKWTLYSSIVLGIFNVLINFIIYLEWIPYVSLEPKTVALSTLFSQIPAILVMCYCIKRHIRISLLDFDLDKNLIKLNIKSILRIFLPSIIKPFTLALTQFCIAVYLARFGTEVYAAFVYCRNLLIPATTATTTAFAEATQITVAHLQGQKNFDQARLFLIKNLYIFVPYAAIIVILIYYFIPNIIVLLDDEPDIIHYSATIMFFCVFIEPARSVWKIVDVSLRGSGFANVPMMLFFASQMFVVSVGYFQTEYYDVSLSQFMMVIFIGEAALALLLFRLWSSFAWLQTVRARTASA